MIRTEADTYSDSARGVTISCARAMRELLDHGMSPEDVESFLAEMGDHDTYKASAVLEWLGY